MVGRNRKTHGWTDRENQIGLIRKNHGWTDEKDLWQDELEQPWQDELERFFVGRI